MRLSDVLSKQVDNSTFQVEGFLGPRQPRWGESRKVEIGKISRNYHCDTCGDVRTFISTGTSNILLCGEVTISVDSTLRCSSCETSIVDAWFLVRQIPEPETGKPSSIAPTVRLERCVEQLREGVRPANPREGDIGKLLDLAQRAYDLGLGAGSLIYLRMAFETITKEVAETVGIQTVKSNSKSRPFKELLRDVDERCHIVPSSFSDHSYELFSELSEPIHGNTSERDSIAKYNSCLTLVEGIINNVKDGQQIEKAAQALGLVEQNDAEMSLSQLQERIE